MTYAHVVDAQVVEVRAAPTNLVRIADGGKVLWSEYITAAELAACGWYEVVEPARPTITATQTFDSDTYEYATGVVTRIYHVRDKTQPELDADTAAALTETERQQARDAVADLDTFLALQSPTNAQTLAVVRVLCRVSKRLIRDAIGG